MPSSARVRHPVNKAATIDRLSRKIRPDDEARILSAASRKIRANISHLHAFGSLLKNIRLLFRMLADKQFNMTWATRGMILAALVYFVLPTDATPDFIPLIGYLDDTMIVGFVIKRLATEIERYRDYREDAN